jgi:hypothetical protein
MSPTKPEEEKRSELICELLRRHEPVIARAVETASRCYFVNGHLFLEYPVSNGPVKVLMDAKQNPRLLAAAQQIGIEVHTFVVINRGSKAGPAHPDELAGGSTECE